MDNSLDNEELTAADVGIEGEDEEFEEQLRTERAIRRNRIILFLVLAAVIIFVIVDSLTTKYIHSALMSLYEWVDLYPLPGAVVLTIVVFVATLAFVPGALLTIGCGAVFGMTSGLGMGVAIGTVVVFVGASLGSIASFLVGRYLLRDCMGKWAERYPLFKAVDYAMEKKGFRIFLLLRLSPLIPFNALNYMAGMTAVTFWDYTLALIGLLPGTVLFTFVGSSAGSAMKDKMQEDNSANIEKGARIASIVVGTVVGIGGISAVSYYAKKELNQIIAEQQQEEEQNQQESEHQTERPNVETKNHNGGSISATETVSD